ncbi:MAG: RsmB/NOP family class I SAM-dependent RNA methyltransferase [Candidatus Njordarchaeota archaeon]
MLFLKNIDSVGLRVFTYNISLPTKTKKHVSRLLFNVITYLRLVDWILEKLDIPCDIDKNLLRILIYRVAIEKNSEFLNRIKKIKCLDLEDLATKTHDILQNLRKISPIRRLSLKYSYPIFFVRRLSKVINIDHLEKLLATMNSRLPYTWLCVNTIKHERDHIVDILKDEGYSAEPDADFYDLIKVSDMPRRLEKSSVIRNNMAIIAEKASVATTHAMEAKDGETILDMCAAPGIKLICTAFKMSSGKIIAVDISRTRMRRLNKLVKRFNIDNISIKTLTMDSRDLPHVELEPVDKILVDAECSSTGLIPKAPDIKLRITKARINSLSILQNSLLNSALILGEKYCSKYVVYSVCSLLPEEAEYVILSIQKYHDYEVSNPAFGSAAYIPNTGRRYFPHEHKTIGFFISRFRKIK